MSLSSTAVAVAMIRYNNNTGRWLKYLDAITDPYTKGIMIKVSQGVSLNKEEHESYAALRMLALGDEKNKEVVDPVKTHEVKKYCIKISDGLYSNGPQCRPVPFHKAKLWSNVGHVKTHLQSLPKSKRYPVGAQVQTIVITHEVVATASVDKILEDSETAAKKRQAEYEIEAAKREVEEAERRLKAAKARVKRL